MSVSQGFDKNPASYSTGDDDEKIAYAFRMIQEAFHNRSIGLENEIRQLRSQADEVRQQASNQQKKTAQVERELHDALQRNSGLQEEIKRVVMDNKKLQAQVENYRKMYETFQQVMVVHSSSKVEDDAMGVPGSGSLPYGLIGGNDSLKSTSYGSYGGMGSYMPASSASGTTPTSASGMPGSQSTAGNANLMSDVQYGAGRNSSPSKNALKSHSSGGGFFMEGTGLPSAKTDTASLVSDQGKEYFKRLKGVIGATAYHQVLSFVRKLNNGVISKEQCVEEFRSICGTENAEVLNQFQSLVQALP